MRRRSPLPETFLLSLLLAAPACAGLSAAAAKVDISPDLSRGSTYMAGFGAKGRKPLGIHDSLYARILLLSDGKKMVGIVGLDLLGFYHNDVLDLRRLAGFDAPGKYLFVASTHEHSGPDTLGLWGPFIGVSGVDHAYHRELKEKIASKLKELASQLQPVRVSGFSKKIDPRGLCRDSRNPTIINPNLAALELKSAKGGHIATVVNWSCHPEVLGRENRLITADYPGPLCGLIEKTLGGTCVFLSGTIGGLMTPDIKSEDFVESSRLGTALAEEVLKGLSKHSVKGASEELDYKSETVKIPIENSRYLALMPALVFGHVLFDGEDRALSSLRVFWLSFKQILVRLKPSERPSVESEVSRIDIGPARLLGIPGEIFPELVIGGYDGRYRAGHALVDESNPNPPDLSKAPKGPYVEDYIKAPLKMVVGLANDELGYIIPEYDYKVQPTLTMLPRLKGHHYEETNSIGPSATRIIIEAAERINR